MEGDPCIYYQKVGRDMLFIGVYVDNIIFATKNEKQLKQVKDDLSSKFDIKDLGELKYFLGIKVEVSESIWIRQPAYTENRLQRLGMQDSKPIIPVELGSKLQPATNKVKPVNQTEYQSAIGNLCIVGKQ